MFGVLVLPAKVSLRLPSWEPGDGQFRSYTAGRFRVCRLVMLTPAVAWR